ncbi:Uma2 family endonuclease [Streptomyces xiamenensis]|uniref:Uma2 family endonuclease n=1 Tax=Streptomyces xiamenensis TaxID=408015 RepID=UPI000628946B|nr:Uma2 family endonuclease [Streptomyces xiamenensis]
MTAAKPQTSAAWPVPPPDGYTVDHLLTLPDLPPHTELIDGSLVFVSPQRSFHTLTMFVLEAGLHRTVPGELRVRREMTVVIDTRQGPEPDICVLRAEGIPDDENDETYYRARHVILAVEVVSPDSEKRDRERKPQLYAQAGIRHFWRVERGEDGLPRVHVYELDETTRAYSLTGIHHDQLKLSVPFTIDIDLTTVQRL